MVKKLSEIRQHLQDGGSFDIDGVVEPDYGFSIAEEAYYERWNYPQSEKAAPSPIECPYWEYGGIFGCSFNIFDVCDDCSMRGECREKYPFEYLEPACGTFVQIPVEFFYENIRRTKLSPIDICILGAIWANTDWKTCKTFVSNGTIKDLTGVSDSSMQRSLAKLKSLHFLTDAGMHYSGTRFRYVTFDPDRPKE